MPFAGSNHEHAGIAWAIISFKVGTVVEDKPTELSIIKFNNPITIDAWGGIQLLFLNGMYERIKSFGTENLSKIIL